VSPTIFYVGPFIRTGKRNWRTKVLAFLGVSTFFTGTVMIARGNRSKIRFRVRLFQFFFIFWINSREIQKLNVLKSKKIIESYFQLLAFIVI
jgi:hypothetical protein